MSKANKRKFYYLFITLFFKTVINFVLVFYVAKVVNVSDFGSFTLSFVVMTIGVLLIDYGYNLHSLVLNYKNDDEISKSISSIISGKIFIALFLIIVFLPFILLSPSYSDSMSVILILGASSIPNSFGNLFYSFFKAKNQYKIEAIGFLLQGILLIILLLINHFWGSQDIVTISLIVLVTKILYFVYSFLKFRVEFRLDFQLSLANALKSYRISFSYGVHLIFGTLILYVDTLFLSYFTDMETVGYYQSGLRLVMAASLFGAVITDGYVPEISKRFQDKLFITKKMVSLFNFLAVFYTLLLITLAFYFNSIINILFSSEFELIGRYLIYILLIILCRAAGIVPGVILTSLGLQKIRALAVTYSCGLSIILNLILVPLYGLEGAFISFLATNLLLNFIYIFYSIKEIKFIKITVPKIIIVLVIYLILQKMFSIDNILCLCISIIINLLIQGFTQKKLKATS